MDRVAVLTQGPTPMWEVYIEEHPTTQTVVFEGTRDWKTWTPINGHRLEGPGPKIGHIMTNAVAGGPARFRGAVGRDTIAVRVRCTRYDNVPIRMRVVSTDQDVTITLVGTEDVSFIIEEEKSLEELLTDL